MVEPEQEDTLDSSNPEETELTDELLYARRDRAVQEQDYEVLVDCDLVLNHGAPGQLWHEARLRLKRRIWREQRGLPRAPTA